MRLAMAPLLPLLLATAASADNSDERAPNPPQTARVRVVNAEGEPVRNATVAPWAIRSADGHGVWRQDGQGQSEPPTVTTDADGLAEFQYPKYASPSRQVACQQITCRVEHPGYAATVYNNVPVPQVGAPTTIELPRGAEVRLAPLDEDLEPITDGVHALWSDNSYWNARLRPRWEGDSLVLPRLTSGDELLRLVRVKEGQATHFSPVLPFLLADGQSVELIESLAPAVSVRGVLSDNVPRPVRNGRVSVAVIAKAPGEGWETINWSDWAEVAEDGAFELNGLPPGEPLQVIALCDGFIAASGDAPDFADDNERTLRQRRVDARGLSDFSMPQVFDLPKSGVGEITLAMEPTGRCEVLVTDQAGEPLAGLLVASWPNVKWWSGGSQLYCSPLLRAADRIEQPWQAPPTDDDAAKRYGTQFSADTDQAGRAELIGLPLGGHNFVVAEPRGQVHRFKHFQGQLTASPEGATHRAVLQPLP